MPESVLAQENMMRGDRSNYGRSMSMTRIELRLDIDDYLFLDALAECGETVQDVIKRLIEKEKEATVNDLAFADGPDA